MKIRRYSLVEASEEVGVGESFVVHCVRARWVRPGDPAEEALDELDLARLRLIATLQRDFGVNDEAVPVILHLLDQLYAENSVPAAPRERPQKRKKKRPPLREPSVRSRKKPALRSRRSKR